MDKSLFLRPSKLCLDRIYSRVLNLRIAKKIGYGYALSLGIAVLGTATGLAIGNYYQNQARVQFELADRQHHLLSSLEGKMLLMRSHPQSFLSIEDNSSSWESEIQKLDKDFDRVTEILAKLHQSARHHVSLVKGSEIEADEIEAFLSECDSYIEVYNSFIDKLLKKIRETRLSRGNVAPVEKILIEDMGGSTGKKLQIRFERILEDLSRFKEDAEQRQERSRGELIRSNHLQLKIVMYSMTISTAISIALALITSQAIARPIRSLTTLSSRAIQDSNFDLKVSVHSTDEIGILSDSFNQLSESVRYLLDQQKQANQLLEEKVAERTQDLRQKNQHLHQVLEELTRSQSQILQSEKMSSLGQLVAGIAHEINNPVNFINGNLDPLETYVRDVLTLMEAYQQIYPNPPLTLQHQIDDLEPHFLAEDLKKILHSIRSGTNRIRDIILSLRNFSRLDESDLKTVNLHEGIDSTLLILQHRLKETKHRSEILVIKDYGQLPSIDCYPGQLNQVFMNLLTNAIDALNESSLKRSKADLDALPPTIWIRTQTLDNDKVAISISDNGCGIPEKLRSRLFDPFFTTKPVGQGTGLGLAIAYQIIVKTHHGTLEWESTLDPKTTFKIQIPIRQVLPAVARSIPHEK